MIVAKYLTKWFNEVYSELAKSSVCCCYYYFRYVFSKLDYYFGSVRKKTRWNHKKKLLIKIQVNVCEQWQILEFSSLNTMRLVIDILKTKCFCVFKFRKVISCLRATKKKKPSDNWFGKVIYVLGVIYSYRQKHIRQCLENNQKFSQRLFMKICGHIPYNSSAKWLFYTAGS